MIVFFDGQFVPDDQARVSVFDHGLLYGDGVFEGIRAYHGKVFQLKEHLERLYAGARSLMLNVGMDRAEMAAIVKETVQRNGLEDAYIRLVISRGPGDLGLDPVKCPRPLVFCIAAKIELYPRELYDRGLELVTVATRRNLPEAINPRIKSLNYLNNIFAKIEANRAGVPEGLMLNQDGFVAEATGDNIFIVRDGRVITPPPYIGLLEGITRHTAMRLARKSGLPVAEEILTRHDLYNADECFLTGTAAEIIPVVKIDGRIIGDGRPGQTTLSLIEQFHELTKGGEEE